MGFYSKTSGLFLFLLSNQNKGPQNWTMHIRTCMFGWRTTFHLAFVGCLLKSCLCLHCLADQWLPVCCVDVCPGYVTSQAWERILPRLSVCLFNEWMRLMIKKERKNCCNTMKPLLKQDTGCITTQPRITLYGTLQPPGAKQITMRTSVSPCLRLSSGNRAIATVWIAHGISPAQKTLFLTWLSTKALNLWCHQCHYTTTNT